MKKFIGTKQFYITALAIAIPIMAQQLTTSFVNLIDNVMVGSVGSLALTSVTVSNRIYLIYNSTLFGICGAVGIFISQYYGANHKENCQKIFNINIICSLIAGLLFVGAIVLVPRTLISFFTKDSVVVEESLHYLKYIIFAYIPYAISDSTMMALRSVGITKVQLFIGIVSVFTNTLLNYLLIFGHFGFPQLGIQGAAIATSVTRVIEMILYLVVLYCQNHYFCLDIKGLFHLDTSMIASMIRKAIPLTVNEILFSLALALIFISYSRCDPHLVPALSVVDTVMQMAYIIFSGISSAVSILIGHKLGANLIQEAKDNSLKLIALGVMISIVVSCLLFMIAPRIAMIYNVEDDIKEAIVILLRIKSCILPFYVYNICIFFVLRSGGDTLSTLIMDSGFLWCFHVLISTIVSICFHIPLVYLYAFIESLDIVKFIVATYFYKKGKWLKNITKYAVEI